MITLWEVCAEARKKFPVKQVSKPRHGVWHIIFLYRDASYEGVNVLPPIRRI